MDSDVKLKLSALRSLLGNVTSPLRHASIELRNNTIIWQCIFDKDATKDDLELMSDSAAEIIADYHDFKLKEIIEIHPFPEKVKGLKNLIYLRNENNCFRD